MFFVKLSINFYFLSVQEFYFLGESEVGGRSYGVFVSTAIAIDLDIDV